MRDWQRAWPAIAAALTAEGVRCELGDLPQPVGGGDISAAFRVTTAGGPVFLKSGPPAAGDMFAAERDGLEQLAAASAVRVPRPLALVAAGGQAVLALEWLSLGPTDAAANRRLGEQLAALHRRTDARYGWFRDNTIGATPQANPRGDDWPDFWRRARLGPQLELASQRGYRGQLQQDGAWLMARLDALFRDYRPVPSLLHGDLWGGNWALAGGEPVIFDPAVYFGDRETDLAMTRLFGGFSREFYRAYERSWPLAPGEEARRPLYQLYHVLNHLNLFGRGYLPRALDLLATLRRRIGYAEGRGSSSSATR